MQANFNLRDNLRASRVSTGLAAGGLLLTGSLLGWSIAGGGVDAAPAPGFPAPPAVEATRSAAIDSYAPLVEKVVPAVVTIRAERVVSPVSGPTAPGHPFFREFFGDRFRFPDAQPRRQDGLGSGVIVRTDGYLLTNHHVVEGARDVKVELSDGRVFEASIVGSDPASDLAVLKIDGANLTALPLADASGVRVGDVALAIGNPLGVGQTVTMGIVSAKGRATGLGDGSFEDFIQTDAPINRGNSGGALINTAGELIGINSQIVSPSGGNIGIGFAIPANMARNVMTQLIEHGEVRRGMLGVTVQSITSDLARSLGLKQVQGALVSSVADGSAADEAGIRRGDVITAINGASVRDSNALRNSVAQLLPGARTTVTLVREGAERTVDVKLGELRQSEAKGGPARSGNDSTGFGMSVEPLTRERARELGVKAAAGLVVSSVQPGGKAADAGLRPGDVIEEADGRKIDSASELKSALAAGERPVLLLIHRGDTTLFVTLAP